MRKIVLATNIAETSLTIEGVTLVVDSCLEKTAQFDPRSGLTRLVRSRISRSSMTQRAGRAGRLAPGSVCICADRRKPNALRLTVSLKSVTVISPGWC